MALSNSTKKKIRKKAAKAIFGKSLALVLVLLTVIGIAGSCLYENNEPFRAFVDDLGIVSTTSTQKSSISSSTSSSSSSSSSGSSSSSSSTQFIPPNDPSEDFMLVHFIDVGQGDSTLFQTPSGSVLVDCGESEYGDDVVEYLRAKGVEELEYFIITHPDSDHMGCAAYVLKNIRVKNFVLNGQAKTTQFFKKAIDEATKQAEEGTLNNIKAEPGDVFSVGDLVMKIYGPEKELVETDEWNDASLIIHAMYGDRSFLLTGDAEEKGEESLLEHLEYYEANLKCDVFSAGHHGSRTSNSKELLEAASPRYVVVSCGEDNSYGHPHQEALDTFESVGAEVFRTETQAQVCYNVRTEVASEEDADVAGLFCVTSTWQKQSGEWKLIFNMDSRLEPDEL